MDRNETRLHDRPDLPAGDQPAQGSAPGASTGAVPGGASAQTQAAAAPARPAPAGQVRSASLPVGEFHPPTRRRQRGLASRSWVPVALSFGTALLVAIALVIYFSQHS
jgi:hypothetical protein